MTDRREEILSRLLALAKTVTPSARRMDPDVNRADCPVFVLFDGDEEEFGERPERHPGSAAFYLKIKPTFALFTMGSEKMGRSLNELRADMIKALCLDTTLAGITGHASGCRYVGCEVGVQLAEGLVADMALTFSLVYLFKPSEL